MYRAQLIKQTYGLYPVHGYSKLLLPWNLMETPGLVAPRKPRGRRVKGVLRSGQPETLSRAEDHSRAREAEAQVSSVVTEEQL